VSFWQDTLRIAVREDCCWMWSNKTSSRAGEWPEPWTRHNDERHVADVFASLAAYAPMALAGVEAPLAVR
jgi:hypothetical protein